jgi:hypothetical protein
MSRLFVSVYLDEDVSILIGTLVRSRGLTALTTGEAGRLGESDAAQLAFAAARQLAMLTHNRGDFEELAAQYRDEGKRHSGIIIARQRSPYDVAKRVLILLNHVSAEEMDNQVMYI